MIVYDGSQAVYALMCDQDGCTMRLSPWSVARDLLTEVHTFCPDHAPDKYVAGNEPFEVHSIAHTNTLGTPLRCAFPGCLRQCPIGDDDWEHWHRVDGLSFCPECTKNVDATKEALKVAAIRRGVRSMGKLDEPETVNHPDHYGGDTTYEVIKVIEAWKGAWYLQREIERRIK